MKREKQIEESKNLIANAFMELLHTKSYDSILISEIADKAGVSRMTLHRHFKAKDGILLFRIEKEMSKTRERIKKQPNLTLEEAIIYRLNRVKNAPHAKLLVHCEEVIHLIADINGGKKDFIKKYLGNIQDKYILDFVIGGFNRILKEWIRNDFDTTPEEMVSKFKFLLSYVTDQDMN